MAHSHKPEADALLDKEFKVNGRIGIRNRFRRCGLKYVLRLGAFPEALGFGLHASFVCYSAVRLVKIDAALKKIHHTGIFIIAAIKIS